MLETAFMKELDQLSIKHDSGYIQFVTPFGLQVYSNHAFCHIWSDACKPVQAGNSSCSAAAHVICLILYLPLIKRTQVRGGEKIQNADTDWQEVEEEQSLIYSKP